MKLVDHLKKATSLETDKMVACIHCVYVSEEQRKWGQQRAGAWRCTSKETKTHTLTSRMIVDEPCTRADWLICPIASASRKAKAARANTVTTGILAARPAVITID